MKRRLYAGARVKIIDSNYSELKVGSVHTITEKQDRKECGETVWSIDGWLFRRSHLQFEEVA